MGVTVKTISSHRIADREHSRSQRKISICVSTEAKRATNFADKMRKELEQPQRLWTTSPSSLRWQDLDFLKANVKRRITKNPPSKKKNQDPV